MRRSVMTNVDRTHLAERLQLTAMLREARSLWFARIVSIAGVTSLLSVIVSPHYVLSFGAVRLSLYGVAQVFAARGLAIDREPSSAVIGRRIGLIRLLMSVHICLIALDLSVTRHALFIGCMLLLGYVVVTAHQTQANRRNYLFALAPPLVSLLVLAIASLAFHGSEVIAVSLFLLSLLLTGLRSARTNRHLIASQAEAFSAQSALEQTR